jgi:hypothetical protein
MINYYISPSTAQSQDVFVFPVLEKHDKTDEVPSWAKDLRNEVNDIRARMVSNESGFGEDDADEEQVFAFQRYNSSNKGNAAKTCHLCNKVGHFQRNCFKRTCSKCSGIGHDAKVCPSTLQKGPTTKKPGKNSNPRNL